MPKRVLNTRMDEAREVLKSAPSLRVAAVKLGINVSTLSRAIKDGRLPKPGAVLRDDASADADRDGKSFSEWARATFQLSRPQLELVDLAQAALDMASNPQSSPTTKLQAASNFRNLLRELQLPDESATQQPPSQQRKPTLTLVGDPRRALMGGAK